MGSAQSQPAPMSEKGMTAQAPRRRDPSAADLLASLSLQSSNKAVPSAAVTLDHVAAWEKEFECGPLSKTNAASQAVLHKADIFAALVTRKATVAAVPVFNTAIKDENTFVSNQKSSGRCWLFALENVLRQAMAKKYDLVDFELSQSYLFFYDSLSKANWTLEQMLDLAAEPLDDRRIQHLLSDPEGDGGQFDMAVGLVETFGLVPQSIFPESFNSSNTSKLDGLLTSKIRGYTLELRELHAAAMRSLAEVETKSDSEKFAIASQSCRKRKEEQMEEVYRILAITLGTPPRADEPFTWEYYDSKKVYHKIVSTPVKFAKEYASVDGPIGDKISLVHDPRHKPGMLMTVDRLGSVVGARPVSYVNAEIDDLKQAAITLIKKGVPVWHGSDVGQQASSSLGILDTNLWDLDSAFSVKKNMTKEQRLTTGDSVMTHAMVITAVHLDDNGKPMRWRIENSWGPDACNKGFFTCTDDWFSENVFQVVADRKYLPKRLVDVFDSDRSKATVLPPWDPMGALAKRRV